MATYQRGSADNPGPPDPRPGTQPPAAGGGGGRLSGLFGNFLGFMVAALIVGFTIRAIEEGNRGTAYIAAVVVIFGVLAVDRQALTGLATAFSDLMKPGA